MDVTFETSKGREFTLEIWFFATVLEIKEMVQKYEGYPISSQTLVFNGQTLKDDGDTELYGILQGSKIQLKVEPDPEAEAAAEKNIIPAKEEDQPARVVLSINVTVSKKRFSLEVDLTDNVGRVKERIQESEGIPVSRFGLYLGSCEMQDDRNLAYYGVVDTDNAEVSVVVRPFPTVAAGHNAVEKKKMKVMVLPKCGTKKIMVEVNPFDNVSELRKELQKLNGQGQFTLPSEGYFFIYQQNVMDEDRTFRWHNVRAGDTVEIFNGSVSGGGS